MRAQVRFGTRKECSQCLLVSQLGSRQLQNLAAAFLQPFHNCLVLHPSTRVVWIGLRTGSGWHVLQARRAGRAKQRLVGGGRVLLVKLEETLNKSLCAQWVKQRISRKPANQATSYHAGASKIA
jgi:hypothetical protein